MSPLHRSSPSAAAVSFAKRAAKPATAEAVELAVVELVDLLHGAAPISSRGIDQRGVPHTRVRYLGPAGVRTRLKRALLALIGVPLWMVRKPKPAPKKVVPAATPACSFCGKTEVEVEALIPGPTTTCICSECVGLCVQVLEERKGKPARAGR